MIKTIAKYRIVQISTILVLIWHGYVFAPVFFSGPPSFGQIQIFDRQDQRIAHLPQPDGFQVPLEEDEPLPEFLVSAFLSIEDERFQSHWGVDAIAKFRALRDNLSADKIVSGGSTITEQYLKNRYYPYARRSVVQKFREATLAVYTSLSQSKQSLLRSYLDTIYFGHRNYGIKAAMKAYFDKAHLETLTEAELVTLLAIIRSPGVIKTSEEYFQERFQRIADQLQFADLQIPDMTLKPFQGFDDFPHVTAAIRAEMPVHSTQVLVYSTVDSTLQRRAKELINQSLIRLQGKNVSNGAIYVVQPSTGEILVWQGSKEFFAEDIDGQVNIITSRRQMGSALKPFIYLYAFMQGAHPDQLIVDLEKDFQSDKQDEAYRPLNYGLREGGVMPLKLALANSFNIASVRMLEYLGLQNIYNFMKSLELGLDQSARHYGLSLALGTPDLRMRDVADAYATLANGGKAMASHLDRSGTPSAIDKKLPEEALFQLFQTLSDPLNRRRSFGTNSILNTSIPFAVKTGTTKNFHDNWTFGYHPDLVVATWVGNNDNSPMTDVDGITGAGPLFHRMVEEAITQGYVSQRELPIPSSLQSHAKCLNSACSRTELIYQDQEQVWYSDLEAGHYCLEDFFIQDINPAEIVKVGKLFDFKDFSIAWCLREQPNKTEAEAESSEQQAFSILKPVDGEVFYLRQSIPLELQEIILKATEEAEWYVDEDKVGYGEFIFIQLELGQHHIQAKTADHQQEISISILQAE